MTRTTRRSTGFGRVVVALALTAMGLFVSEISPAAAQTAGGYGGSAFVDLVHLDAVNIPGTIQVADLSVAPARADVVSTGLAAPLAPARSSSRAANLDLDVLSGTIPLTGLILEAAQTAPPDNAEATVEQLLDLPVNPVLNALVARSTAHSRWPGDATCVAPGTPISLAQSEVADANVITAGGPTGTALVAIDNQQGSTVFTRSTVGLVDVAGSANKGVTSVAHTQLTALTLFKGTTNELTVNVLAPPVVTATATGLPGGATVAYSEPVLQIVQNGTVLGELNAADANLTVTVPGGVAELKLGTLTSTVAADGTSAEGNAELLSVTVVGPPLPIEVVAPLSIAAGVVSAKVPAGGVNCGGGGGGGGSTDNPLREVHKDASAAEVRAEGTFTYTVAVPNRGTCTLTEVKVVDTVTGPSGTTIASTAPPATTTEGLTATWDDIGPIAPNETKTLVITIQVPDGLAGGVAFSNNVVVSALCDGQRFEQPAQISGPTTFTPAAGGCKVDDSNMGESHREVRTGQTFNYYVHVFNSGDSDCTGITVTQTLDENSTFVSCSDNCTNVGQEVTWTIAVLPGGSSRTLVATAKVNDDAPVGQRLPSSAVIDADDVGAHTARTPGPIVAGQSVLAGPNLPRGSGTLAKTGPSAVTLAAAAALAGWVGLRRRFSRRLAA